MPRRTRHRCRHARGGHVTALRENQAALGVRQPLTAALISETQPQKRVRSGEAKAPGPFTTISTEPLTWTISCILPFSTDQHYTPQAELGHFMALFTQGCLSCLPSMFSPGRNVPTITSFWIDRSATRTAAGRRRLAFREVLRGQIDEALRECACYLCPQGFTGMLNVTALPVELCL